MIGLRVILMRIEKKNQKPPYTQPDIRVFGHILGPKELSKFGEKGYACRSLGHSPIFNWFPPTVAGSSRIGKCIMHEQQAG